MITSPDSISVNLPATERTHYPALDGLRGIAIILVILYHNFNFIEYFNYGWLGVDLFFVLSGFLITNILLNTAGTKNYFKNFYARRVLRIFPVYYLSLFLFIIIFPAIKSFPLDMSYYQENQFWFWTYLQNWTLVFNQEGQGIALNHFWSLAVEEQYYLLWPLIIILFKNPGKIFALCILLIGVVIAARFYIWLHREDHPAYERLFTFTRIDGILIGSMLAAMYKINVHLLRKYFTFFLIALTAVNYLFYLYKKNQSPDFPVWAIAGFTTFSLIFAIIVYEAVMKDNRIINFFLTNAILRFLGKYSYGFYIFHFPVFLIMKPYADKLVLSISAPGSTFFFVLSSLLATIAGFLASVISFHAFEKHFLKLKQYF